MFGNQEFIGVFYQRSCQWNHEGRDQISVVLESTGEEGEEGEKGRDKSFEEVASKRNKEKCRS